VERWGGGERWGEGERPCIVIYKENSK